MSARGARAAALRPFTPRIAEIDYVSVPFHPIVFVDQTDTSECAICESLYPFDPRNLSILDSAFERVLTNLEGVTLTDLAGTTLTPL